MILEQPHQESRDVAARIGADGSGEQSKHPHAEKRVYSLARVRPDRLEPNFRLVSIDCEALEKEIASGKAPLPTPPPPTGPVAPCLIRSRVGTVHSGGITMAVLAQVLTQGAERVVVDTTGLGGTYALELDYRPASASVDAADPEALPILSTALEEQLGLRLVSDRAPVPTLIIDRISRLTPD